MNPTERAYLPGISSGRIRAENNCKVGGRLSQGTGRRFFWVELDMSSHVDIGNSRPTSPTEITFHRPQKAKEDLLNPADVISRKEASIHNLINSK